MGKTLPIFIVVFVLLAYMAGKLLFDNIALTKENKRKDNNITALTDSLNHRTDNQGRQISEIAALQMSVNKLKNTFPALVQQIKEIGAKPARAANITEIRSETEKRIFTSLRDSLIIRYQDTTAAKLINYRDSFYTVTGLILPDTAQLQINSRDTLIQVIHRGTRIKPWLWIFSPRQLTQTIRTANPANHITYSRYIEIKK